MSDSLNIYPEIPDCHGRLNLPIFRLIELGLATDSDTAPAEVEKVFDSLESFRYSVIAYWLRLSAPFPSQAEMESLEDDLVEEERLLEQLRGAYLWLLIPLLPRHVRYGLGSIDDALDALEHPKKYYTDMETRRRQFQAIDVDLMRLYDLMSTRAPEYARLRIKPTASLADLKNALAAHRQGNRVSIDK